MCPKRFGRLGKTILQDGDDDYLEAHGHKRVHLRPSESVGFRVQSGTVVAIEALFCRSFGMLEESQFLFRKKRPLSLRIHYMTLQSE